MPLQLTTSSPQELSPEDLAPFKETLLAYLRARNAQTRQQVDSNLHITLGEKIPLYTFTLQVLLESRGPKPENVTKALRQVPEKDRPAENVLPPAPPKDTQDLWQFPSEPRPDFTPYENTYFVPNTLQTRECNECFQRGETGCKQCFGKGEEACQNCLGSGTQSCLYCKGLEKVTCIRCGGEGRMTAGGVQGVGRAARCDACNGTGKFPCTHCKEGKVPCPACNGGGKGPCKKCNGQGKTACPTCLGDKKIVVGLAFQADFKPFQVAVTGLAVPGPREAVELAAPTVQPVGEIAVSADEPFEKQVQNLDAGTHGRATLQQLAEKLRSRLSPNTRAVKYRLEVAEGSVIRVSGYCAGQEFSFWMAAGRPEIIAEKDPLASLSNSVAVAAEEALSAGDWKKAVDLARETLSYSPGHLTALTILSDWRRKVFRECLVGVVASAVLAAVFFSGLILHADKGLHKTGALFQVSALQFVVALVAGVVAFPFLLRLYPIKVRWPSLAGALAAAHLAYWIAAHWVLDWNPVRTADQAALNREMEAHFKFGVAKVFYEPDLLYLQGLYKTYKDSEADLSNLQSNLDKQLELKKAHEHDQKMFNAKVAEVAASGLPAVKKKERIEELKAYYKLLNIDLSAADQALEAVGEDVRRATAASNTKRSRITIISHPKRRAAVGSNLRARPTAKAAAKSKTPSKPAKKNAGHGDRRLEF